MTSGPQLARMSPPSSPLSTPGNVTEVTMIVARIRNVRKQSSPTNNKTRLFTLTDVYLWVATRFLEEREKRSSFTVTIESRGLASTRTPGKGGPTLHFSFDDQGTFTAETGGLRLPVRLPRCTRLR
ncbi:hypothetical protein ALC53_11558 [Atta colombica]|uniref:Uncharacterized protein n=1 Tax=Atta colombica TaxID=520822 RepID=A0A195B1C6_9HYME|nr:hypothetical protein ALC53_11558 [Atta colombica]